MNIKELQTVGVQARIKKMLSRYNWITAEPYYDVVIDNGSTGKSKIFITLRQFKERVEEGQSLKAMKEDGISKHLIQFFSNFLQGKITLTKSDFEDRYNRGKELEEICEEFNIQRGDLTYLRQLYDIKRKGATFIKRKKTEVPPTPRQKEIIYGSLMGDAKRNDKRYGSSVGFGQCEKQEPYLKWKFYELKNLASENSLKKYSQIDKRNGKTHSSWRFYTKANTYLEEILSQFYEEDKQITTEILKNLTPLSIAVWFMDDGYKHTNGKGEWSNCVFCTDSFSEQSCDNIVKWFDEKWGIKSHKRERKLKDRMGYRIVIKAESRTIFISLIEPFIIPSMRYKIGL